MANAGRFLTTHVGSLPREDDLIEIMFAKEDGLPLDMAAVDARIAEAVQFVVDRQAEAGLDIINDGEQSKPSYATYIKDRLDGFGGTATGMIAVTVSGAFATERVSVEVAVPLVEPVAVRV